MERRHRQLRIDGAYDFAKSLESARMGRSDPTSQMQGETLIRATHTPTGPATVAITWTKNTATIDAEAYGPGAETILDGLEAHVGAHDDPSAFVPDDLRFVEAMRRTPGIRMIQLPDIFHILLQVILQQRVAWRDALSSYRMLVQKHGEPAPGPYEGLWVPPKPKVLAKLPTWAYREAGVELKRSETIRRAATSVRRIEETKAMTFADATQRLEAFRGIGPWTSQFVLATALGDPDAVPTGDLHLPHHVARVLAGESRGTDERMLELLEPYRPHRWRALRLLGTIAKPTQAILRGLL